jgi:hypothetical protein
MAPPHWAIGTRRFESTYWDERSMTMTNCTFQHWIWDLETLGNNHAATRRHIPEQFGPQLQRRENLKTDSLENVFVERNILQLPRVDVRIAQRTDRLGMPNYGHSAN